MIASNFSKFLGLMNLLPLAGFDGAQCLALVVRGFLHRKAAKPSQAEVQDMSHPRKSGKRLLF
jgi:membrane-associated protease RseP (regulator of RpoE activity)